jgi:site-specific DNA-methyltransferase (adenine-specific)
LAAISGGLGLLRLSAFFVGEYMESWQSDNGLINLYCADCLPAMQGMKDKAFDLAVVDPPYGVECNISTGGGSHTKSLVKFHQQYSENAKVWNKAPDDKYFKELFRVSHNRIIWGGNYFTLPPCRCFVAWDKVRYVENFSQVEFAWTSFDSPALIFKFCGNGGFILSLQDAKIHPTQKPVALYHWLLTNYAKPGQTILDTHLGSGSIAIACWNMGYSLTGYEIDQEYFEAAVKRIENHIKQGRLF